MFNQFLLQVKRQSEDLRLTCCKSHKGQEEEATSMTEAFAKLDAVEVFTSSRRTNRGLNVAVCLRRGKGPSGLPPPAPLLTFCHTLEGRVSSCPQPNYFPTHLASIKRCAAGVRASGCCHGHCHSADFPMTGRKTESRRKLLVALVRLARTWRHVQNNHMGTFFFLVTAVLRLPI